MFVELKTRGCSINNHGQYTFKLSGINYEQESHSLPNFFKTISGKQIPVIPL